MFSDNQIFRELHNAAIESLDNLQPINSFPVFAIMEVMKSSCEEREFLVATGSVCLSDSLIKMFMDTIPPSRRSSHTLTVLRQIAGGKVILIKVMKVLFPDGVTGLANDRAFLAILGALFKAGSRVFAVECIKIIFCRLVQAVQNQVESLFFLNGIRAVSERSRPKKNYYDTRRDEANVMRPVNDARRDPNRVWAPLPSFDDKRKRRTRANGASFESYSKRFRTQVDNFDNFVLPSSSLSGPSTSPSYSLGASSSLSPPSGSPCSSSTHSTGILVNRAREVSNCGSTNVDKPASNLPNSSQDSRKANESINQPWRFNEEASNSLPALAGSSLDNHASIILDTTTPSGFGTMTNVSSMMISGLSGASQGHSEVFLSNAQACTSSSGVMGSSPQRIRKASSPPQQQINGIRDSIPSTPSSKKISGLVPSPIRPSVFGTVFTTSLCLCNKVDPPTKLPIQRNEDSEDEESVALALMTDIPDSPICPGFSFDDLPLPADSSRPI
ncbi:uncharacterized protein LACBIDRAFT_325174 [Laccaria bicolor S238N-H82]|uniref:Predicted protein n=1 Tax=Laccaria bicolor (strain S238N-H82 / ATCC MYA-4686) TaxID=486041 RepID=B0D430_LACBS|nr:uncharacterized protein LACBIDRAFT_325174 [Laccaria bicolor S238N-H82]EDR10259.1 predicted protein [Laccaria bicolor S238N-H82]|eukprot:XP_001878709.1 predicted protein [Laccaria bicolor S238N-H82]